jgi:hypothetical protein
MKTSGLPFKQTFVADAQRWAVAFDRSRCARATTTTVMIDPNRLPWTRASLTTAMRSLGVVEGALLSVHASMSQLGYVIGGAETVVDALLDAVGPGGTVVMQTHTSENSDPAAWKNPPVPEPWWEAIREHTPAFRPERTPGRKMEPFPSICGPGPACGAAIIPRIHAQPWAHWPRQSRATTR